MVSTIHSGEEEIMQRRRRSRDNQYNKQFLPLVFGERSVADVEIPRLIDYYNHKMKGVDLSDQLNASYRPQVRVRENWFAMWEHVAAVARVKPTEKQTANRVGGSVYGLCRCTPIWQDLKRCGSCCLPSKTTRQGKVLDVTHQSYPSIQMIQRPLPRRTQIGNLPIQATT